MKQVITIICTTTTTNTTTSKDFKRGVNYSAIFVLVSRFFSMSYKVGFLLEDESYNCWLLEGKELVPTII